MSATNRGAARSPGDYYSTPAWCVHRLLEQIPKPAAVFDPCAGDGAIFRAARAIYPGIPCGGLEINPLFFAPLRELTPFVDIADALEYDAVFGALEPSVTITNPPYKLAERFIDEYPRGYWLLRLAFLSSARRAPWLRVHRPNVHVLPNRPMFGRNKDGVVGSDASDYGWFEWPGDGRWTLLEETPRDEINADLVARGLR